MTDPEEQSWSDNPNAPKISYHVYVAEKGYFAGFLIGSILYGMLIVLFFKCMAALLKPLNRRGERIKWGLLSYTIAMFSFVTVYTAMNLHILSISFIDNREFPGGEGHVHPGPYGYFMSIYYKAISVVPNAAFCLNNWLADGFLLHRCYLFYSMNLWVIAFPFIMYLGSVAAGILAIWPRGVLVHDVRYHLAYHSVTLSLNILLTLMIVVRLIMRSRNVRAATKSAAGFSGLYRTVATMLIESSALFAVSSLLVIGPLIARSALMDMFFPILAESQVIAPLLIIQRIADQSALTSDTIAHGTIGSSKARSRGESTGGGSFPGRHSMKSVGEYGIGVETIIDICRDET